MKLVGANAKATVTGADELPGKSNYFIGNDPKKWRTNVPTYAKVKYAGVYPGVDLVYYGNQGGQLEYDFVVAPGADPSAIVLSVGAGLVPARRGHPRGVPLRIAADGDLVVETNDGEIRFHKPVVYQERSFNDGQMTTDKGPRTPVDAQYVLTSANQAHFALGPYDHSKPLFIDPVLIYSTYLGGSGYDLAWGIAVDSSGNAYVTGETGSTDFPTVNPLQATNHGGPADVFVAKLNTAGSALVYSTYLGGSDYDWGIGIAVDSSGNAYVTGQTWSTDFPTVNPLQATNHGAGDAFVAKLDAASSALVYSTYLGGSGYDYGYGIAVDSSGNAYVTGNADSTDFPTANPMQASNHGYSDAFVAKLNADGSALVYSTYLGGSNFDQGFDIAVDSSGNAYVTGNTDSTDFPTANPMQASNHGYSDAFVAKLNADGSALVYSTYLGGSGNDYFPRVAVDPSGNAYVTGFTESTDFPTVNPLQATSHGYDDAFVAKLNAAGSSLVYSTYLGGSYDDYGYGIAVDASGSAYVAGSTGSTDFPTVNPLQASNHGDYDAFVAKLNAAGSALVYATYLGGSHMDEAFGIAVDSSGNAYLAGYTQSADFPTVSPLQASYGGGLYDAFVAKISPANLPGVSLIPSSLTFPNQALGTTSSAQTVTLANVGSADLSISGIVASGDFAQTNTCGTGIAGGGTSCSISVTFTPTAEGARAGSVSVTDNASGSPQVVTLTGTGVAGRPRLIVSALSHSKNGSTLTLSLKLTNTGAGSALNTLINQIVARRLGGTGTVTYLGPPLPIAVGNLAVGATTTEVLTFNVPSTVTKFSVTENGTTQDIAGQTYSFASSQVVFP